MRGFTDASGPTYYPLLLSGVVNGEIWSVGVAALALGERPTAIDQELVIAIGTHLIEAGDTAGVRA